MTANKKTRPYCGGTRQKLVTGLESVIAIIAFIIVMTSVNFAIDAFKPETVSRERHYVVADGDTLWSIGHHMQAQGDVRGDVREIIYAIQKDNPVGREFQPGDVLKIKMEVEK